MFGPILPILPLACLVGFAFLLWNAHKGHPRMFPVLKGIAGRQAGVKTEDSVTRAD
jgi:hypothetical protein